MSEVSRPPDDGRTPAVGRTIDAIWRIESAKIIARVARIVGDVGLAEDFAQDALVAALERWPESGIPDNPGAWLMATAKRRAIDRVRRNVVLEDRVEILGHELQTRLAATRRDAEFERSAALTQNDRARAGPYPSSTNTLMPHSVGPSVTVWAVSLVSTATSRPLSKSRAVSPKVPG